MKEVIYYTDPDDPRFGTTEEVEHPDPPAPEVVQTPEPTKAEILADVQRLLAAVEKLTA